MGKVAIEKVIKFIEKNKHLDSSCAEPAFRECTEYMNTAEEICSELEKCSSNRDLNTKYYEIVFNIRDSNNSIAESIFRWWEVKDFRTKEYKFAETKLKTKLKELYEKLGTVFDETKIIDSLVKRNNRFFENNGLKYMQISRNTALKEFTRTDRSTAVTFSKITFWINKLTKYINYIEYYNNYKADSLRSHNCNDKRLQFISKIKTDFLKELFNSAKEQVANYKNIPDNKDRYKICLRKIANEYQEKYEELFKDTFKDLNLYEDLERLIDCNIVKDELYSLKSIIGSYAIVILLAAFRKGTVPIGISKWGITQDESKKYILNVSIKDYPLPLSFHIQRSQLYGIWGDYKMNCNGYLSKSLVFPLYDSIRTNNKNIVSTNILCVPTEQQRNKLKEHAKREPDNKLVQVINNQITRVDTPISELSTVTISGPELLI